MFALLSIFHNHVTSLNSEFKTLFKNGLAYSADRNYIGNVLLGHRGLPLRFHFHISLIDGLVGLEATQTLLTYETLTLT